MAQPPSAVPSLRRQTRRNHTAVGGCATRLRAASTAANSTFSNEQAFRPAGSPVVGTGRIDTDARSASSHLFDSTGPSLRLGREREKRLDRSYLHEGPGLGNRFTLPDREDCRFRQDCVDPFRRYEWENFLKKHPGPNRNYLSEGFSQAGLSITERTEMPEPQGGSAKGSRPAVACPPSESAAARASGVFLSCLGSSGASSPGSKRESGVGRLEHDFSKLRIFTDFRMP